MRTLVTVVCGTLLMPALTVQGAPASSRQPRVLFFGDSLVQGTGTLPRRPLLVDRACTLLHWTSVIDGHGGTGYTTGGRHGRSYTYRLRHERTLRSPYDVVVLEGGTNDARYGALPHLERDALAVVERVHRAEPGARLVLLGVWAPPQVDQTRYREADELLRLVAGRTGLTYVSQLGWSGDRLLSADGYHPSAAGYIGLGQALAHAVDPRLPAPVGAEGIEPPTTRL